MAEPVSQEDLVRRIKARKVDYLSPKTIDPATEKVTPAPNGGWIVTPKEPEQATPTPGPDTEVPEQEPAEARGGAGAPQLGGAPTPTSSAPAPDSAPDTNIGERISRRAKTKGEGREKFAPTLQALLSRKIEMAGKEVTEENMDRYLERVRDLARSGSISSPADFEIANIDAMMRWGKRYKTTEELKENYGRDAYELQQASEETPWPTQKPNVEARIIANGKELGTTPGWENPDEPTRAYQNQLVLDRAGSAGAVAQLAARDPELNEKVQEFSKIDPEDLRAVGKDEAADLLVSPYFHDGPGKRKNIAVFVGQNSDGSFGFDVNKYREVFEGLYFDIIRREEYKKPAQLLSDEEISSIEAEAAQRARRDVESAVARLKGEGLVAVNTDTKGTIDALMEDEGWLGVDMDPGTPLVKGALRALGADPLADRIERMQRPWAAMLQTGLGFTPTGTTTWGTEGLTIQKENPIHSLLRAGPWSVIGAWLTLEDPDAEFGGREHLENYMRGYDFTQDAYVIGETLASFTPWADSRGVQQALGITGTVGLALLEPDVLGGYITAAGGSVRAGAKYLGASSAARSYEAIGTKLERLTEEIDSMRPRDIEEMFNRDPETFAHVAPEFAKRMAAEAKVKADIPDAVPKEAKKASAQKAKSQAKKEVRQKEKFEEETQKYAARLDKAKEKLGEEVVESEKRLTAAEIAFLDANEQYLRAKRMHDLVQQMDPSVLPPRKGMKVEFDGKEFTYEGKIKVGGVTHARILDESGTYVTVPMRRITRKSPWTRADLLRKQQKRDQYRQELTQLKADLDAAKAQGAKKDVKNIGAKIRLRKKRLTEIKEILGDSLMDASIVKILDDYQAADKARRGALKAVQEARVESAAAIRGRHRDVLKAEKAQEQALARDPDLPKVVKEEDAKVAETTRALQDIQGSKEKIFAAQKQMYEDRWAGMDPEEVGRQILKETMLSVAQDYKKLAVVVRKMGDATPVAQRTLDWEKSIAGQMEGPEPAQRLVEKLEVAYGPRAEWHPAIRGDDFFQVLDTHPEMVLKPEGGFREQFFRLEQKLHTSGKYQEQWVNYRMEAIGKEFFNPSSDIRRHVDLMRPWKNPDAVIAAGFRYLEKKRRGWGHTYQTVGSVSQDMKEVAQRASNGHAAMLKEVELVYEKNGSLNDVIRYLSSREVVDEGIVFNLGRHTPVEKFRRLVLSDLDAAAKGESTAFEAFIRAALPPGETGRLAAGRIRQALIKLIQDEYDDGVQLFEDMWDVVKKHTAGSLTRTDHEPKALRHAIWAIVHGATEYDLYKDVERLLGPLTHADAEAVNYLISRGRPEAYKGGRIDHLDLERGYEVLNRIGYTLGADEVQRSTLRGLSLLEESDEALHTWLRANGEGVVPEPILRHLTTLSDGMIKELEAFHTKPDSVNRVKKWLRTWLSWWRSGVVIGHVIPRIPHFATTYVGDAGQVMTSRGLRDAVRHVGMATPMYADVLSLIPGVPKAGTVVSESAMRVMADPAISAVMRGDPNVIIRTAEGDIPAHQLLREAKRDGTHEFILSREMERQTARQLDMVPEWMRKWMRRAPDLMHDIQTRTRLAWYMRDRVNGLSRAEAKKNMLESFFDWKHKVTPWEAHTIGQFSAFYSFWRNALSQMGMALTEGIVKPDKEYWARVMTGRTKFARSRQQGTIAMAIPEFVWWDDPDEVLDDYEQIWEARKRKTPWWLGVRPLLTNSRLTAEEVEWAKQRGKDVNMEAMVLPMVTALDSLYLMATTHAFIAANMRQAAGDESITVSAEAPEIISQQISDMLAPVFSDFVTAVLKWARGEGDPDSDGVPLRTGEVEALRAIGLLDVVAYKAPDRDGVERFKVYGPLHNALVAVMRTVPVAATDAPLLADILSDPAQSHPMSRAYLSSVLRDLSGFGKTYMHNTDKSVDIPVNQAASDLKKRLKRLEPRSRQSY